MIKPAANGMLLKYVWQVRGRLDWQQSQVKTGERLTHFPLAYLAAR